MDAPFSAPPTCIIDDCPLPLPDLIAVAREQRRAVLAPAVAPRLQRSRALVEGIVAAESAVYGINTGFGNLARVRISRDDLQTLQRNLVRSHAAGVGEPLDAEIVRAMLLILVASLARGYSGVRPALVEALLALLNAGVQPVIPWQGSVGASGDLAPWTHLALVVQGEGEAIYQGRRLPGGEALRLAELAPLPLEAKEGLALINGTHLMAATLALAVHDAHTLILSAEGAAAASVDALRGTDAAFDPRIHELRPHAGQRASADHIRRLLAGSEIRQSHLECARVQDPYTLRCIPQVIGAVRDALDYCRGVIETELGAVTDNPLCFPDDGAVISGGNFHGQPLALAADFLAIALAQLAGFSERRTYALLSTWEGDAALPVFLTGQPGLNSGYMIAQYVAAALVSENKVLAHPASADSIPTSAGTEDFVSMGATAVWKLRRVLDNATRVVAVEWLCAAQAIETRRPLRSGGLIEDLIARVRELAPPLVEDRPLHGDIEAVAGAIRAGRLAEDRAGN